MYLSVNTYCLAQKITYRLVGRREQIERFFSLLDKANRVLMKESVNVTTMHRNVALGRDVVVTGRPPRGQR